MPNKKRVIILLLISVLLTGCLSSCSSSEEDGTSPFLSETADTLNSAEQAANSQVEQAQSNAQNSNQSDSNSASSSEVTNKTMRGLPDVIDTISTDPENKLMLVNKLHAVTSDYYPTDMVAVDGSLSTNQGLYFKREAYDAYLKMLNDANAQGINFLICSAYRSYDLQKSLYNNSMATYGAAFTYTYSAYPGRSEHHTGWAIDLTSSSMGYGLSQSFADYPEGKWVNENCSDYGFIIRYPKGKTDITGYDYEPWHLRYVGVEAAKEITSRGITLEEYLGEA